MLELSGHGHPPASPSIVAPVLKNVCACIAAQCVPPPSPSGCPPLPKPQVQSLRPDDLLPFGHGWASGDSARDEDAAWRVGVYATAHGHADDVGAPQLEWARTTTALFKFAAAVGRTAAAGVDDATMWAWVGCAVAVAVLCRVSRLHCIGKCFLTPSTCLLVAAPSGGTVSWSFRIRDARPCQRHRCSTTVGTTVSWVLLLDGSRCQWCDPTLCCRSLVHGSSQSRDQDATLTRLSRCVGAAFSAERPPQHIVALRRAMKAWKADAHTRHTVVWLCGMVCRTQ